MTSQEFLTQYPGIEFKKYESNPTGGYTCLGALIPIKYQKVLQTEVIADMCASHFGFWIGISSYITEKKHTYGILVKAYNKY